MLVGSLGITTSMASLVLGTRSRSFMVWRSFIGRRIILKRKNVTIPPTTTEWNPQTEIAVLESISIDRKTEGGLLSGKAKDTISADEVGEVGEVG